MRAHLPRRRTDRRGLRLWPVGTALVLAFTVAVLVAATVFYTAWDLLGAQGLKPEHRIDSKTLFDLVKLSFGVVAGAGALVALVVAYRRQRVDEDGVEGDVGAYMRRRDNGPVTFHIATNNGNIAANSAGVTQNAAASQAAFDWAQILAVVSLIRQLAPALTSDAGEQQALLAQTSELQTAAEAPTPDRVAVRRITDGVLSTIRSLTNSPDVQRLALEAVEQGIQNL